jgi:NAD(P)H-flavin reductase
VLGCLHGKRTWEIVIRPSGDAAEALARAPLGTSIEAGGPFGVGFPRAHGRRLIMAATGRAIAAVRAVMQERIADGDGSKTTLFIGVTREAELPLPWEAKSWLENGAEVVICTSQQELEDATHAKGRVQDVVARRLDAPAGTPLLLVGHAGMIEAMKAWAKTKDLDAYVNV